MRKKYSLRCPSCGTVYEEDGTRIGCEPCDSVHGKTILEFLPDYKPEIDTTQQSVRRYEGFLPGDWGMDEFPLSVKTIKSDGFAKKYGFTNLHFTLTGYAPKLSLESATCSFKELEAITVLHRLRSYGITKPLIVASAGNTARAFAYYATKFKARVIIVTPANCHGSLWLPDEDGLLEASQEYVKVVFLTHPANYKNASELSQRISAHFGDALQSEGGFLNIGRTMGLGMCALNFFDTVGKVPDHYVQAVGSGAGAIGAMRCYGLLSDDANKVALHLVQNAPYTPLVDAIEAHAPLQVEPYLKYSDTACSPMLTSADPGYDYPGGLKSFMDKGQKISGEKVSSREIYQAQYEFWRLEGLHLLLPAAAAIAALIKDASVGRVDRDSLIQVNLTGVGDIQLQADKGYFHIPSALGEDVDMHVATNADSFDRWIKRCGPALMDY